MYTRLLMLLLLVGACFAAPQSPSVDASVTANGSNAAVTDATTTDPSVTDTTVTDTTTTDTSVTDTTVTDISVTDITVTDTTTTDPSVTDTTTTDATDPTGTVPSAKDVIAVLQDHGYNKEAVLFGVCPLSWLDPDGTQVTVPGISDEKLTAIWNQFTDVDGKLNVTVVCKFLQSFILLGLNTKAQLLQAAVGTLKNHLNQSQNIKGYLNNACVWNSGNLTKQDILFAGGIIQGLDNFVQKGSQTLTQLVQGLVGKVPGLLGAALGGLVRLLTGLTGSLGNIFNSVIGAGNTFIMPSATQLASVLLNPSSIKQYIFPGIWSASDLAQLAQSGQNTLTNLLGQAVPFSISSSHILTILGHTYSLNTGLSSGANANLLTPQ